MMGINGTGPKGWRALQKGLRELLLCEKCEQHFNEYFEKPFRLFWIESNPLPAPWPEKELVVVSVPYAPFKLFHLSVIFRASVSSLPTYSQVNLGPHEEKIRRLLLDNDPAEDWQYQVFAYAVLHHETRYPLQFISQPVKGRLFGHTCYQMIYGGVSWCVNISSNRSWQFDKICLQPNGSLPLGSCPWNEVAIVRQAARALPSV